MPSILSFGHPPPAAQARLSISSSPPPSMSSSSDSPMDTPTFDANGTSLSDAGTESRIDSRNASDEIVPKIEERELMLADVKEEPLAEELPISPTEPVVRIRRGRGRPRIYPPRSPTSSSKHTKARSKTGCTTCRKRKKKCDETRPFCLSCQKNNIHCEGYKPVEIWKSGKERAAEGLFKPPTRWARKMSVDTKFELPPLMEGVESDLDRTLLQHFVSRASSVLTLHGDRSTNPFTRVLLPMALQHEGLMHSVLCLSASHLCSLSPSQELQDRQTFHRGKALHLLNQDLARQKAGEGGTMIYEDANVAQILLHLLHALCEGDTSGEYRLHMIAAKKIAMSQKSKNPEFQSLFDEFFYYHYIASQVTSLVSAEVTMMDDFKLPFQVNPETAALIGVSDGLFGFLSKISNLRRRLRTRIDNHDEPTMDYEALLAAHAIDSGLRNWTCPIPPGSPRYTVSMLYRQATWVYLYRTTKESAPHPYIKSAVDDAIRYMNELPAEGWIQSNVLLPLFLVGCAAFEQEQRIEINRAFSGLMAVTGLGNIHHAREVVEKVWELMDAGDPESWDWEKIINNKGWDFLAT
ncbi:fungal-specific transcription factor domain-containing protein [Lophiotrema nucula]|uniref:Fungal-specific transcription factor domain-containing protein n=1 Tax=Lophiotrema nucula TaxID=690887 RepID=A0A6A5YGC9_9PLEO|nr:fungal-specific transcription factor domain-containing protein [Lophiotrema nucula]